MSQNEGKPKSDQRKRGRPKGDGLQGPEFLARQLRVVFIYNRARQQGKGYEAAIQEAASWIRYSATEVKRLLAGAHRNGIGYIVIKGPTEEEISRGEGNVEYGIGPIPIYPRIKRRRPR